MAAVRMYIDGHHVETVHELVTLRQAVGVLNSSETVSAWEESANFHHAARDRSEMVEEIHVPIVTEWEIDPDDPSDEIATCKAEGCGREVRRPVEAGGVKLSFYDFDRQHYAETLRAQGNSGLRSPDGEFMIGEYVDGGVGPAGEFKLVVHRFPPSVQRGDDHLTLQACVFGDGLEAFNEACRLGLTKLLQEDKLYTRDGVSRALLAMRIADASDIPLAVV